MRTCRLSNNMRRKFTTLFTLGATLCFCSESESVPQSFGSANSYSDHAIKVTCAELVKSPLSDVVKDILTNRKRWVKRDNAKQLPAGRQREGGVSPQLILEVAYPVYGGKQCEIRNKLPFRRLQTAIATIHIVQ